MPSSIGLDMAETVDQPLPRTARSPRRRRASMPLFFLMKFQACWQILVGCCEDWTDFLVSTDAHAFCLVRF